ncbi:polysaccharide deacetylase family protein [uncultured Fibrobacter sp.]|uniref:polysaccharide deacetylase family protein n=1 Tax=uncultured Fibrobacter sp. TaxID=261512 RepID=UPI0025F4D0DF|nr:polysaccharide deacetylase family protein [uncultured Fibrobacter sp.]
MEQNKDIADIQAAEATFQKKKKFILCYHSFSVNNFKKASVQIRKLAEAAGSPISIAVIPAFGAAPESEAEQFREELDKFVKEGYEIMLHGARHRADLSLNRSIAGKLALLVSNNEAEFAGIDERFTQALLKRSLALWKAHGNGKPSGFIPPIWFGNKYLKEQALEIFDYYEDFHGIYQKVKGNIKKTNSATLSFSILPTPLLGIAQTYACLRMLLPGGVHRLVFHDKDFRTIGEKRILNMVRYISTLREKIMYKDL